MLVGSLKTYLLRLKILYAYDYLKNNYFILAFGSTLLLISLNCYYFFSVLLIYMFFVCSKYKIIFRVFLFLSIVICFNFTIANHVFEMQDFNSVEGFIIDIKEKETYNRLLVRSSFKKYYVYDSDKTAFNLGVKILAKGEKLEIKEKQIAMSFDYKAYLKHEKIVGVLKAREIEVKEKRASLLWIKEKFNSYINNNFDEENKMFLRAVVLGDTSLFDEETMTNIKTNGISHLFAVSGLHIGLLVIMLTYLLKKLKLNEKAVNIIIAIFLLLYLIVTSFSPSIMRASLMWGFICINKHFKLGFSLLDIISIIFIILIIINPFYMYNMGFVLSFLVTFNIILMAPLIKSKKNVLQILYISIASQIITLPLIINFNFEINLLSFIANVVHINLFTLILPISFVVLICPPFKMIFNYLIIGFLKLVDLSSYINIGLVLPYFDINKTIVYYVLLVLMCLFYYRRNVFNYLSLLLLVFILIMFNLSSFKLSQEVYFFSLYNGEASLITDKFNRCNVLIDTGDGKNREVSNYLKRLGIKHLDFLVLTHNHFDHNGEALEIINQIDVKQIVVSEYDRSIYSSFPNAMKVGKGSRFKKGGLSFEVFSPSTKSNDENDNSIVLKVKIGGLDFLFLGDASKIIIEEVMYDVGKIDVLKVGHHGSKTSLSFKALEVLNPSYAIVQTGQIEYFAFPDKEVIDALKHYNIKTYRTDLDYSVKFKSAFNKTSFKTQKSLN